MRELLGLFICRVRRKSDTYTLNLLWQNVTSTPVVIILLHMVFGGLTRRTKRLTMRISKESNLLLI